MARFPQTYCSQCGHAFGPGPAGYSHCRDHGTAKARERHRLRAERSFAALEVTRSGVEGVEKEMAA